MANEVTREFLLRKIDESERGKYREKIRNLLDRFGHTAEYRVRRSSLERVLSELRGWGIAAHFPNGTTTEDFITLSRSQAEPEAPRPAKEIARFKVGGTVASEARPATHDSWRVPPEAHPFAFLFNAGDAQTPEESLAICNDLFATMWAARPVCLLVEGPDEFFYFAGGLLSALMRRRAVMRRQNAYAAPPPLSPAILALDDLKRIIRQTHDGEDPRPFPEDGGVYLIRDVPGETEEDEFTATLREFFVPHCYRLKGRFSATSGAEDSKRKYAFADSAFKTTMEWIAVYAGSRYLAPELNAEDARLVDMASVFAEASRLRDVLIDRAVLASVDQRFRAGFESTEHVAMKKLLLGFLMSTHPRPEEIQVEEFVGWTDLDEVDDGSRNQGPSRTKAKPDLRIPKRLWIEVETLRSISFGGANPFFALESKLSAKLRAQREEIGVDERVWLVVPSDVALLAAPQMAAVTANLSRCLPGAGNRVDLVVVDVQSGQPVVLDVPVPSTEPLKLRGASWRESEQQPVERRIGWSDIAGYSKVKKIVTEDVLTPLKEPERYRRFGLAAPNGLLLYGLPGCGKSLMGRVLAGEAGLKCKLVVPSDLTSMWLGEGVAKIRALFDWAIKQPACLIVIDEIDALASRRSEQNMHSDEKRQINELLAQLDRIKSHPVAVVATTNYVKGIDPAIRRSGRFDVKIPVFPPSADDRAEIFQHYLERERRSTMTGAAGIAYEQLAAASPLFTPADIETVVEMTLRRSIVAMPDGGTPRIDTEALLQSVHGHQRSIHREDAESWIAEARSELGNIDELDWLEDEVGRAFGTEPSR